MADQTAQDRLREQRAAANARARTNQRTATKRRRDDRRDDPPPPPDNNRARNNNGNNGNNNNGRGGNQPLGNWADRYNPDPYDPDAPNPYYDPDLPGKGGGKKGRGIGRHLGEQDPEALFAAKMEGAGLRYNAPSAVLSHDSGAQYRQDQFDQAYAAYRQTLMDRPNLTFRKFLNNNPAFQHLLASGSGAAQVDAVDDRAQSQIAAGGRMMPSDGRSPISGFPAPPIDPGVAKMAGRRNPLNPMATPAPPPPMPTRRSGHETTRIRPVRNDRRITRWARRRPRPCPRSAGRRDRRSRPRPPPSTTTPTSGRGITPTKRGGNGRPPIPLPRPRPVPAVPAATPGAATSTTTNLSRTSATNCGAGPASEPRWTRRATSATSCVVATRRPTRAGGRPSRPIATSDSTATSTATTATSAPSATSSPR